MQKIIVWLILAALGWYGYTRYQERVNIERLLAMEAQSGESPAPSNIAAMEAKPTEFRGVAPASVMDPSSSRFKCDGRTYCSQMTSCEEATYFLKNCPDTKMDGNNDGIPCEKQWCK
jgi:hypothetical protein